MAEVAEFLAVAELNDKGYVETELPWCPGLVREILYRALHVCQVPVFYPLATQNGNIAQISKALELMQSHFAKKNGCGAPWQALPI